MFYLSSSKKFSINCRSFSRLFRKDNLVDLFCGLYCEGFVFILFSCSSFANITMVHHSFLLKRTVINVFKVWLNLTTHFHKSYRAGDKIKRYRNLNWVNCWTKLKYNFCSLKMLHSWNSQTAESNCPFCFAYGIKHTKRR